MKASICGVVAVAALAIPCASWGASSPIDLGPLYTPPADAVVPGHDGTELALIARGQLLPDAQSGARQIFLLDRASGEVRSVAVIEGEIDATYYLSDVGAFVASRHLDRFAFSARSSRINETGGRAVWVVDRNGALKPVTRAVGGGLSQTFNYTSTPAGFDASGRWLVFWSDATDLVAGDTNGMPDVFVYDATTEQVIRVSVGSSGEQSPGGGWFAAIAPDGSRVAFISSSQLVAEDLNNLPDVYTVDLATRAIRLISRGPGGESSNGIQGAAPRWSDDARYLFFQFASAQPFQVEGRRAESVLHDTTTGRLRNLASVLNVPLDRDRPSSASATLEQLSASGRYALLRGRLVLPPPYGSVSLDGLYLADLQTSEMLRVDMLDSGVPLTDPGYEAALVGDSPRVPMQNRSPELGTTMATLAHDWQPPPASRLAWRSRVRAARSLPMRLPGTRCGSRTAGACPSTT
jgi:Tol biopolymer transport system component